MFGRLLAPSLIISLLGAASSQAAAADVSQRFLVMVGSAGYGHVCITDTGKARGLLRLNGKPVSFSAPIENGRFSVSAQAGGGKRFECEFALSTELASVSSTLGGEAVAVNAQAFLEGPSSFGVGQLPVSVSVRSAAGKNIFEGSLTPAGKFLSASSTRVELSAKSDKKTGIVSGKFGASPLIGIVTNDLLTARCDNGTRISIRATGAPVISLPPVKSGGTGTLVKSGTTGAGSGRLQPPTVNLYSNLSSSQTTTTAGGGLGGYTAGATMTLIARESAVQGTPFGGSLQVDSGGIDVTNAAYVFVNIPATQLPIPTGNFNLPPVTNVPDVVVKTENSTPDPYFSGGTGLINSGITGGAVLTKIGTTYVSGGTVNVSNGGTASANGWLSMGGDTSGGSVGYINTGISSGNGALTGWSGASHSTSVVNVTSGGTMDYSWWTRVDSAPQDLNIPTGVLAYKDSAGQLVSQPSSTAQQEGTVLLAEGDSIVISGRTYTVRYAR